MRHGSLRRPAKAGPGEQLKSGAQSRFRGNDARHMLADHSATKSSLRAAMDALYRLCVIVAGAALVLISAVIPWGVFTRYVLNSAASWPEPMAILLTIVLTFFGAAACYRAGTHMSVSVSSRTCCRRLAAARRAVRRSAGRAGRPVHGDLGHAARRARPGTSRSPSFPLCRSA